MFNIEQQIHPISSITIDVIRQILTIQKLQSIATRKFFRKMQFSKQIFFSDVSI